MINEPLTLVLPDHDRRSIEFENTRKPHTPPNRFLSQELQHRSNVGLVGADHGLRGAMKLVRKVAALDSPVLLLGETGTGKNVMANTIHTLSSRRDEPLIRVDCGAITDTLLDSELFGHEKGAFTGAHALKRGRFERAHRGTVFLDEIGELPREAQVRLLRVLQEKEIERVGGTFPIRVDIRIIAATHRDLEEMLEQGRFRKDLYFRLKVFPIKIPPLRERTSDIPTLVQHFIQKKSKEMKLEYVPRLDRDSLARLDAYSWPGNVRELENTVERSLILCQGGTLTFEDIVALNNKQETPSNRLSDKSIMNLDEAMARHIHKALVIADGKVEGKDGAADLLDINPRTLRYRMKKLGIPCGRKAVAST